MNNVETYLWGEVTDLVCAAVPSVEETYPEIGSWFDIKQGWQVLEKQGATVLHIGLNSMLGLPHNRDLTDYMGDLTTGV